MGYPMYPLEEPKQASFNWFPFVEPLTALNRELRTCPSYYIGEPSRNNGANGYFNEAGPSNIGGSDDPVGCTNDILELASRECLSWHQGKS